MSERWVGIAVSGDKLTLVDATVDGEDPVVINKDFTWKLQAGDRPKAYNVIHSQIGDYLKDNGIDRVVVKASAASKGMGKAHLNAAELRGVVLCAAASQVSEVSGLLKGNISNTFGNRKMDDYLKDEAFWTEQVAGVALRSGSREAAMLLLAAR